MYCPNTVALARFEYSAQMAYAPDMSDCYEEYSRYYAAYGGFGDGYNGDGDGGGSQEYGDLYPRSETLLTIFAVLDGLEHLSATVALTERYV